MTDIHNALPPVKIPWWEAWMLLPSISGVLLLVLFIIFLFLFFKKQGQKNSPRKKALQALKEISLEEPSISPYLFSIHLAETLQTYIESSFPIPARKQTSIEFLRAIQESALFDAQTQEFFAEFTTTCDALKFSEKPYSTPSELLAPLSAFIKKYPVK